MLRAGNKDFIDFVGAEIPPTMAKTIQDISCEGRTVLYATVKRRPRRVATDADRRS